MIKKRKEILSLWILLFVFLAAGEALDDLLDIGGTISFSSVGRAHYAYDIHAISLPDSWSSPQHLSAENLKENRLTDGASINYNGHFVEGDELRALNAFLYSDNRMDVKHDVGVGESESLIYVSERSGYARMYTNVTEPLNARHARASENLKRNVDVVEIAVQDSTQPFMNDNPSVGGNRLVFVSTAQQSGLPGIGWAAVFATNLVSGETARLTPVGVAEYSPAISPSGEWIAAASNEKKSRIEAVLETELYLYRASDGSGRRLVAKSGGWPTWQDEQTIFFHRQAADGWWSIYRIDLPADFLAAGKGELPEPERVTPPGVHVLTPAASRTGNWLAVATRRPQFLKHVRHVEIFDLTSLEFIKVTELLSPNVSHFSPFLSSSGKVGYHRCRGNPKEQDIIPTVEVLPSSLPNLALQRVDGSFPTFSPDGKHLAFNRDSGDSGLVVLTKAKGVYVINLNGEISQRHIYTGRAFGIVWDPTRAGVMYITAGKCFEPEDVEINILSISNIFDSSQQLVTKQLTKKGTGNNAMPYPSPDGKKLVFRSGRTGYKNLYIVDAVDGEEKGLTRLTNGNWTDNHPQWSPSGEWIIFISDRLEPGSGHFDIFMIHPDGSGLRRIINTGSGVKSHPTFLGVDNLILFTSNYAGFTAEPISVPLQFMPQGEVFIADVDNPSSLRRLTHNAYEDGSATWTPYQLSPSDLQRLSASGLSQKCKCNNPDYYADAFPTVADHHHIGYDGGPLGGGGVAGCAYARQGSDLRKRHYEL